MKYAIKDQNGEAINTIIASVEFAEEYCLQNGFIFELVEETPPAPDVDEEQEESIWKELDDAYSDGVNSAYDA